MTLMQDVKMHVDVSLSKWFGFSTLLIGLENSQRDKMTYYLTHI